MIGIQPFPTHQQSLAYRKARLFDIGLTPLENGVKTPASHHACNFWWRAKDAARYYADGGYAQGTTWLANNQVNFIHDQLLKSPELLATTSHGYMSSNTYAAGPVERIPSLMLDLSTLPVFSNTTFRLTTNCFSFLWVGELVTKRNVADLFHILQFGSSFNVTLVQTGGVLVLKNVAALNTSTFRPPTGQKLAILVSCGKTRTDMYVNTVESRQILSPNVYATTTGMALGGGAASGQKIYEIATWDCALDPSECSQILNNYCSSEYEIARNGFAGAPTSNALIPVGDSLTAGLTLGHAHNWTRRLQINPSYNIWNYGISGQTMATILANETDMLPYCNSSNYFHIWAGNNDVVNGVGSGQTACQNLFSLADYLVANGVDINKISSQTITTNNVPTERDSFNTYMLANYATHIGQCIDVASDVNLGVTAGNANPNVPANYTSAGHMSELGLSYFIPLYRSVVNPPF